MESRPGEDAAASVPPVWQRPIPLVLMGVALVAVVSALGWWLWARGEDPFTVDVWWDAFLSSSWLPLLGGVSLVLNFLGGGWFAVVVVPIIGVAALLVLRRPWAAVLLLAAQVLSVAIVQAFKAVFGRIRPEEMLVLSDAGSFPSGHVAEAATLATAAVIIFPRLFVVIVGLVWTVAMAFSRTYLHAHWLSDTLGGALAGIGATLIVAGCVAVPLLRERAARSAAVGSRGAAVEQEEGEH